MATEQIITAEELFGAASRLAEVGSERVVATIASLGVLYQIAVAVAAIVFIFIVVRYASALTHILLTSILGREKRTSTQLYAAEIRNIEIVTSLLGVLLIALSVVRCSIVDSLQPIFSPLASLSSWELAGITLSAIVGIILVERFLLWIVGSVTLRRDVCIGIWHIKLLHFSCVILLTAPSLLIMLLNSGFVAEIALYISVTISSISLFLFIKETFLLFRAQRVSIFHWFLYLCTLEIFPLSLLLAPILREGL